MEVRALGTSNRQVVASARSVLPPTSSATVRPRPRSTTLKPSIGLQAANGGAYGAPATGHRRGRVSVRGDRRERSTGPTPRATRQSKTAISVAQPVAVWYAVMAARDGIEALTGLYGVSRRARMLGGGTLGRGPDVGAEPELAQEIIANLAGLFGPEVEIVVEVRGHERQRLPEHVVRTVQRERWHLRLQTNAFEEQ